MEINEKFRKEETRRLLKWITENDENWILVRMAMSPDECLIAEEYRQAIRILKEQSFYQLLIMLIYSDNTLVSNALENTILKEIDGWSDEKLDNFVENIIYNITNK